MVTLQSSSLFTLDLCCSSEPLKLQCSLLPCQGRQIYQGRNTETLTLMLRENWGETAPCSVVVVGVCVVKGWFVVEQNLRTLLYHFYSPSSH